MKRVADQRPQPVVVELFCDVVVGAVFHRLNRNLHLVERRHHDDLDLAVVVVNDLQHLKAAHTGHPDVKEHQIDVRLGERTQTCLAGGSGQDLVVSFEDCRQGVPHPFVVVDDENRFRLGCHAR